jgi:hypothetical protein
VKSKPIALIGYRSGLDTILEIIEALDLNLVGIYDKYFYGNTTDTYGVPFIGSEDEISNNDIKNLNFFFLVHNQTLINSLLLISFDLFKKIILTFFILFIF